MDFSDSVICNIMVRRKNALGAIIAWTSIKLQINEYQLDFPKWSTSFDTAKWFANITDLQLSQETKNTHMHKHTDTLVSSLTELPQLANGIRADKGKLARLLAMAPSSSSWEPWWVACLATWRTEEETRARTTATLYPQAVWHGNLPQAWHKPWPKMMALCPCCRPLPQPFTSAEHLQSQLYPLHKVLRLILPQHTLCLQNWTLPGWLTASSGAVGYAVYRLLSDKWEDTGFNNFGYKPAIGLHQFLPESCHRCSFQAYLYLRDMDPLCAYRPTHKQAIISYYTLQSVSDSMWADC